MSLSQLASDQHPLGYRIDIDAKYIEWRHQRAHRIRMREHVKTSPIVRAHFPNPRLDSHPLHGELLEILPSETFNDPGLLTDGHAFYARWITGPSGGVSRIVHVSEIRPVTPLEALAAQAE